MPLVVVIFIWVCLFRSLLFEPFSIPAVSMSPSINVGDHVVVSKIGYGNYGSYGIKLYKTKVDNRKKPKRGEVFVFKPPHKDTTFVKRVIGLPGDEIMIYNKRIIINGNYIGTKFLTSSGDYKVYTENLDSENYKVKFRSEKEKRREFYTKVPDGHYFVLGDNRDNSSDSRYWGPVKAEDIIGKVVMIW